MYNPCTEATPLKELIAGVKMETFFKCINFGLEIDGWHSSFIRVIGTLLVLIVCHVIAWKLAGMMVR